MFIQSSFCSVLISHNLVIYSSVYLLHFNGSVLVLLLWLLVWDYEGLIGSSSKLLIILDGKHGEDCKVTNSQSTR
ncbi:hypothetical protein Peur_039190 [Populus x canadensis]